MINILFIVPPHLTYDDFINPIRHNNRIVTKKNKHVGYIVTEMPLGCMSMSAYVKSQHKNIHTRLIDFNVKLNHMDEFTYDSFEELFIHDLQAIDFKPDIICITSLFISTYESSIDIIKCCKSIFPYSKITLGGGVAANLYKQILASTQIDAICIGEGESPLLSLVKHNDFRHPTWVTKNKIANNIVFRKEFISDLDILPIPDYSIINLHDYSRPIVARYVNVDTKIKNIHYMTTRGCCHRCTFCASHSVHGRKVRALSLKRIKEDLEYFKSIDVKIVIFQDDHLLFDVPRFKSILKYLKELGLSPVLPSGLAMYAMDEEMLHMIKDLGLNEIALSIESGSERILKDIMHKPLNYEIIRRVVDMCKRTGLYIHANVMFGLPGETKADIEDSIKFLKTLDVNWFTIFTFTPLVGSSLYDICVSRKYIEQNDIFYKCDFKKPVLTTEDFTAEYINNKIYDINLDLNFVNNSDIKHHRYQNALKGLLHTISVRPDHVLAHYYAHRCYTLLNKQRESTKHLNICKQLLQNDTFWQQKFEQYNIII